MAEQNDELLAVKLEESHPGALRQRGRGGAAVKLPDNPERGNHHQHAAVSIIQPGKTHA